MEATLRMYLDQFFSKYVYFNNCSLYAFRLCRRSLVHSITVGLSERTGV